MGRNSAVLGCAPLLATPSPSQALTRQIPPFVAARHLPPARGKSFLKGRALGSPRKLHLFAKASPFGRGGCERSEQTERASLLPAALHFRRKRRCKCRPPLRPFLRKCICSVPQSATPPHPPLRRPLAAASMRRRGRPGRKKPPAGRARGAARSTVRRARQAAGSGR